MIALVYSEEGSSSLQMLLTCKGNSVLRFSTHLHWIHSTHYFLVALLIELSSEPMPYNKDKIHLKPLAVNTGWF